MPDQLKPFDFLKQNFCGNEISNNVKERVIKRIVDIRMGRPPNLIEKDLPLSPKPRLKQEVKTKPIFT